MRLFVGIRPGDGALEAAAAVQAALRAVAPADARWVAPEAMHVTLAFLGELEKRWLPDVRTALAGAVRAIEPFTLAIGRPGAFPGPRRARVLWLGLAGATARLEALARTVREALRPFPVERDARPFRPHLTLARFRTPRPSRALAAGLEALPAPAAVPWEVRSVTLFESTLSPGGARHRAVATFPLAGA